MGQSTKGEGPQPKERGNLALTSQLPTEFTENTCSPTSPCGGIPGSKGQAGETQIEAVKTTAGTGGVVAKTYTYGRRR